MTSFANFNKYYSKVIFPNPIAFFPNPIAFNSISNEKSSKKVSTGSPSSRKRIVGKLSQDEDSPASESAISADDNVSYSAGCVPLSKPDDPHWLSAIQCFVRSNMVEIFSLTEDDVEETEYESFEVGQVGIRCKFCAGLLSKSRSFSLSLLLSLLSFVVVVIVVVQLLSSSRAVL